MITLARLINEEIDNQSFDPKELEMGIEVEKEHFPQIKVRRKIAMDHLKEDPKYYTKLKSLKL